MKAYDSSLPAPGNLGTGSLAFNYDNIHPTASSVTPGSTVGTPIPGWGPFVKGTVDLNTTISDTFPLWGWLYLYNYSGTGWVLTYTTPAFDLTSSPAIAFSWNTGGNIPSTATPWPQGFYAVYRLGMDYAGNQNADFGSSYNIFYVDNNAPSIVGSNSPTIPNYVTSVVSVPYSADANYGYLASVGYSIYDSSVSVVASSVQTFPVASLVAATKSTFTVDTRALTENGPHSISGRAGDHALNSSSTARVPFEVCNRVATITTVTWTPGTDYGIQVDGTLVQLQTSGTPLDASGKMSIFVSANGKSFSDSLTFTGGSFSYAHTITEINPSLTTGDTVQVDVENVDSGCHTNFYIDEDTDTGPIP